MTSSSPFTRPSDNPTPQRLQEGPGASLPAATVAQRAREAVEVASSVHFVWDEGDCTIHQGLTALQDGSLLLALALDSPLAQRLARVNGERHDHEASMGVTVGVTDLAPVAVRQRIRAQLTLTGRLRICSTWEDLVCRLGPADIVWWQGSDEAPTSWRLVGTEGHGQHVDVAAYQAAVADPLATEEAELLLALVRDHRMMAFLTARAGLAALARREGPVVPVRLDRHGIVLRLDRPGAPVDVRLRFGHDATDAVLAWAALENVARP